MSYSDGAGDRFVDMVQRIRKAAFFPSFPFPLLPLLSLSFLFCLLNQQANVLDVACQPQQSLNVRPQVPEFGRFYTKACAMRKRKRACQCSREIYFSKRQVEACKGVSRRRGTKKCAQGRAALTVGINSTRRAGGEEQQRQQGVQRRRHRPSRCGSSSVASDPRGL